MASFTPGISDVPDQRMAVNPTPANTITASEIGTAGNILGAVGGTLATGYVQGQQLEKVQQNAGHLAGYAQDLLRISDLEQQGALKPDTALRQYRLRTAQMIANHPLQQDEIFKTYGNIVEKAGLGQNVVKDYQQQQDNANQLKMSALQDAQKAGWGSPNDPPEQQEVLAEKHQQFLYAQSQLNAANALLEHKAKENQLVSSGLQIQQERGAIANQSITLKRNQLGLAQDQAKQQFLSGAKNLSDAYFGKWQNDTGSILKDVQAGTLTKEDAVKRVNDQLAAIHSQVGGLALGYDSQGSLEALTKPLDMQAAATIDQITGKSSSEITANTQANILGMKNIQLLSNDPDFLTLTATSKMLPAAAGSLQQAIGDSAINLLKRNKALPLSPGDNPSDFGIKPKPGDITHNDDPKHNAGVDQYFTVVKSALSNMNAGIKDPDLKSEIDGNISNILAGVGTYSKTMSSPKELNSAVKFLADPQIGNYLKSNPDLIKGDTAVQATEAYKQDYERAVLPLIQAEFLNAKVHIDQGVDANPFGGTTGVINASANPNNVKPSTDVVRIMYNGTGASFVANPTNDSKVAYSADAEAKRLNREVAPIMNNLIRANAHLSGSTDYKKSYDNFIEQLNPVPTVPAVTEGAQ